ncbi:hypothetical protein ELUMI_v1c04970 [Williamsoniiplasma luminosum]|uniref:Uncharacterized protein n=1 Tax=Williamsoniiplasma luminosum TaxID=214888 RepID=A0A2K8NWV4_9MOLU|nr:hypothetical protein [Williamsoniiplasma luminosum]ATZ17221.1 hypothetical protein ELUMI_v1c04970 [Williamsoniiplasma luminosum]
MNNMNTTWTKLIAEQEKQKIKYFSKWFNKDEIEIILNLLNGVYVEFKNQEELKNIDMDKILWKIGMDHSIVECSNCDLCNLEGLQTRREWVSLENSDISWNDWEGDYYEFYECKSNYSHEFIITIEGLNVDHNKLSQYDVESIFVSPTLAVKNGEEYNKVEKLIKNDLEFQFNENFDEFKKQWSLNDKYLSNDEVDKYLPNAAKLINELHLTYPRVENSLEMEVN